MHSSNDLWLSPTSAWELLHLAERGRLKLDDEAPRWVTEALTRGPAQEAVLNVDIAVRSHEIMPGHPDPADRFLVATALVYGLTLVTADLDVDRRQAVSTPRQPLSDPPLTSNRSP